MNLKFTASEKKIGNKESVRTLVNYLEKENKDKSIGDREYFFDHENNTVFPIDVINRIDNNKKKLGANDAKFYMLILSPSEKENEFLGNDPDKLKTYTREFMNAYAANFNKGLQGSDLVYYAKVEWNRYDEKKKDIKDGNNLHVHIIVSRRDKNQYYKLSPMTNHQNTKSGPVKGGFCRKDLMIESEKLFDKSFNYNRTLEESWDYQFAKKHHKLDVKPKIVEKINPKNKEIKPKKGNDKGPEI
ncbi:DUF5712 family protein [uncultured Cytophaga sp.]|uniref:DUF5712 family protein n=1 Tax=uncultured Cytophaga sp. TaxID=160238 RepID=UPI00261376EA|nr:DUF5712 family protein [uncultured Cytophaga sp.]